MWPAPSSACCRRMRLQAAAPLRQQLKGRQKPGVGMQSSSSWGQQVGTMGRPQGQQRQHSRAHVGASGGSI